jgi:hypothetical protein
MAGPLELTMEECIRLKGKLESAGQEGDVSGIRDLLREIQGADARNKLSVRVCLLCTRSSTHMSETTAPSAAR